MSKIFSLDSSAKRYKIGRNDIHELHTVFTDFTTFTHYLL